LIGFAIWSRTRNAPQKHVWRAQIVRLSAEGLGTNAIMRETGKSKTCVWRWQERFVAEGADGLLRDNTRRSRIAKLDPSIAQRVVALTMEEPPGETTHWTGAAMAKAVGVSISSVQRIWRAHGLQPTSQTISSIASPTTGATCFRSPTSPAGIGLLAFWPPRGRMQRAMAKSRRSAGPMACSTQSGASSPLNRPTLAECTRRRWCRS
jgi:transposase